MDNEQRDACLIEIKVKVARLSTDIHWIKWIIATIVILATSAIGIKVLDIFIHG